MQATLKNTLLLIVMLLAPLSSQASDFAWLDGLSAEARADESGFRARLAARLHIGEVKIKTVINDVRGHADAYMVLRLAEMSHQPVETVIRHYKANRGRGWGVLAKRLGIKPGSREFHALKRGHDLHADATRHGNKGKDHVQGRLHKQKHGKGKDRD